MKDTWHKEAETVDQEIRRIAPDLWPLLRQDQVPVPGAGYFDDLQARILVQATQRKPRRTWQLHRFWPVGVAASVALMMTALIWMQRETQSHHPDFSQIPAAELEAYLDNRIDAMDESLIMEFAPSTLTSLNTGAWQEAEQYLEDNPESIDDEWLKKYF